MAPPLPVTFVRRRDTLDSGPGSGDFGADAPCYFCAQARYLRRGSLTFVRRRSAGEPWELTVVDIMGARAAFMRRRGT